MRDRLDELKRSGNELDIDVVLVTFTDPESLDEYQRRRQMPFPILLDPNRTTYAAYDLGRGSIVKVWGLASMRRYLGILRQTRSLDGLASPTEDTRQLGGDFVIGADGRLAWGFWSTGPADRPTVDEILTAVDAAQR